MKIILGLIVIAVGTLITIKSEWFFQTFGSISFFEKYMHMYGGGRLGYKLVGVFVIFVGTLIMTSLHARVIGWVLGFFPGIG